MKLEFVTYAGIELMMMLASVVVEKVVDEAYPAIS
jgi:hypothetical protein